MAAWSDRTGVVVLPGGAQVRGRPAAAPASPADFTVLLVDGPAPAWPYRRVRWPDFWIPADRDDAVDALREALRRAYAGERVEVACRGGKGRTGTGLAALAVLDGLPVRQAVPWVRRHYHSRAVETPWQRWWLRALPSLRD
ncbi:protein phosphatase [Micromonospora sp. PLK6-60]|uniref:protein-tyrosine phosphatase family protein n=1 Tax=Micromonospora sp. PLK6-60 TaxID=2873383 RepID=UPI001CA6273A|nr:protein phosphatase [Micromonospora sp. PLK6-60]MBY8874151.1 protein phosphatase [Micromonospora sp. PLK6-60]